MATSHWGAETPVLLPIIRKSEGRWILSVELTITLHQGNGSSMSDWMTPIISA